MLYAGFRKRGHLYYALYLVSFILLNMSYTGHGYAWLVAVLGARVPATMSFWC